MKRASKEYRVVDISSKNPLKYISVFWNKLAVIQKIIFIGIILAVIVSLVALHTLPQTTLETPLVSVIDFPIKDKAALDRIVQWINQEGVKVNVTEDGIIQVADEVIARRMRVMFIVEDLIPSGIDSWKIFDKERWTITDFERNINFRRERIEMITDHIKVIEGIDDVYVIVIQPERTLFRADQKPIIANVIITPKSESDIFNNRKKIEGIQKILKFAIDGLDDENIVIATRYGFILNNIEQTFNIYPQEEKIKPVEETIEIHPQEKKVKTVLDFMLESSYKNTIIYNDIYELGNIEINPFNNINKQFPGIFNGVFGISIFAYKDEKESYKLILKDSPPTENDPHKYEIDGLKIPRDRTEKDYKPYLFLEDLEPNYYQVEFTRKGDKIIYNCKKVSEMYIHHYDFVYID